MDKLTKKQKGFVKDYVETDNATEAVMNNYNVKDRIVAKSIGSENLTKPYIKQAIQSLADRIPDDKLHQVIMEGLDAETNEKPDYSVRHKYLDTSLKLKGAYQEENRNINIMMPVLVKFLDKQNAKTNETNSNGNTD